MMRIFVVLLKLQIIYSCSPTAMNNEMRIIDFQTTQIEEKYFNTTDFGLWSQYQPLTNLVLGVVPQISDKICYLNIQIFNQVINKVDFLFYDCIDYQTMQITKNIEFYDKTENLQSYKFVIDNFQYESRWYCFFFRFNPSDQQFSFLITDLKQILYQESGNYVFPYNIDLKIKVGGQQQIETNPQLYDKFNMKEKMLYYFPGNRIFCDLSPNPFDPLQNRFINPQCQVTFQQKYVQSINITGQDVIKLGLEQKNCDSFVFSTWIKIKKIQNSIDNYYFKLIQISSWNENQQLQNSNLSPFQLLYKIQNAKLYVQFTTYSYTLPITVLNFQNDPFLLSQEFEIINDYYRWSLLQVVQEGQQLSCSLSFIDQNQEYHYEKKFENIKHFQNVQLQVQVGNLNKDQRFFFEVSFYDLKFLNSINFSKVWKCHVSCLSCDGPTQFDCLSCDENLNRKLLESSRACPCTLGNIDDGSGLCKSFIDYQFSVKNILQKQSSCPFGYFPFSNDECKLCPTSTSKSYINCLECISNPNDWQSNFQCESTLYFDQESSKVASFYQSNNIQYERLIFDSEEVLFCKNCLNIDPISDRYQNFRETQIYSQYNDIFFCGQSCIECRLSINGIECLKCAGEKLNGICYYPVEGEVFYCKSPYYYNSQNICILCQIKNCQYCFEFLSNDLSQCTLYKNFELFQIDEFHKIGCALCDDGYIFDFTIGECIFQQSKILNCLRSFINLDGTEVCTLSSIDDFTVAPQITNCQQYIKNCKECILTPFQVIKCIICEPGYVASTFDGACKICNKEFSTVCLQGDRIKGDGWVQLIQSFLMQFLPQQYYYPSPILEKFSYTFAIFCQDGYRATSKYLCFKYCTNDCLNCHEINKEFVCVECALNQNFQIMRSQLFGRCLECPYMCAVCSLRDSSQIKQLNSLFILTDQNEKFTLKCLMPIQNPNIILDTSFQIARYLISGQEDEVLVYQIDYNYLKILMSNLLNSYESKINQLYLNQIGAKIVQMDFIYDFFTYYCSFYNNIIYLEPTIKQKIFSLKEVIANFTGNLSRNLICGSLQTNNFDIIYVSQIQIEVYQRTFLEFKNTLQSVEVHLENLKFYPLSNLLPTGDVESTLLDQQIRIEISSLKYLTIKNMTFNSIEFSYSYIFNLSNIQGIILFDSLIFVNCSFQSMNVFNFYNSNYTISFKSVLFEKCNITNSKLFNLITIEKVGFQSLKVINSLIQNTIIIDGNGKFISLLDIQIIDNQIFNSNLIIISGDVLVQNGEFKNNSFYDSLLFYVTITNEAEGIQIFENSNFILKKFQNSSLLNIQSSQVKRHEVVFDFIKVQFESQDTQYLQFMIQFLFKIQCQKISILNFEMNDFHFVNYYLYSMNNIQEIIIKNIYLFSAKNQNVYPFQSQCSQISNEVLGLFSINQFNTIFFQNITIINQNIVDSIIIEIISNQLTSVLKGSIIFEDINFQGNILSKLFSNNLASFISIYSNNEYSISFNKLNFKDNFYLAKSQDVVLSSSSFLLQINCYACNVQINGFNCEKNMLFNSTNSFIKITAYNLKIENYNVKQHNVIKWNDFKLFFSIDQLNELDQDQINTFVNKILGIKNKACAGSFQVNQIQIKNGYFSDLIAQNVPVFDINTGLDGVIQLYNIIVQNITFLYSNVQEYRGTIHINSADSLLSLVIKNTIFSEIYQFTNSPILSILPSNYKNQIIIVDVVFQNCFSIQSLIFSLNLNSIQDQSYLEIINTTLFSDLQSFKKFTNNIGKQRIFETAIFELNTLFQVSGCQLLMKNISVSGLVLTRILSITDLPKFSLINSNFKNIQQLVRSNFLYFSQLIFSNSILKIENCIFNNISNLIYPPIQSKQYILNLKFQYSDVCKIIFQTLEFFEEFYFNSILDQINFLKNGAIIFISKVHSKMQIFLLKNKIINNQCFFCLDGGIHINFVQQSKLIISDFLCYSNSFSQNGCLNLISTLQNGELVKIMNSKFFNNQGTKGAAVSLVNMKFHIENTYLMNNDATDKGGAVYIENFVQNSKIYNSYILKNRAYTGGGLYLNSQHIGIDDQSFKKSFLSFNEADTIGNNLIDQPTHFQMTINNREFKSTQINKIYRLLELRPYKIVEQGQLKFSNVLMLPGGQQINVFKLFNPKSMTFYHYIQSMILSIHNSLNEKLNNLNDTTCLYYQTVYDQNLLNISDSQLIKQIYFDQEKEGFDLSDYSFNLDPYINHYLMISIQCQKDQDQGQETANSANQKEQYQFGFQFLIKTLKCQLGEFFVADNCQICDSQQGYYSVNYNVTKCSLFDKEKFEAITSNQIKLKAGYWRPNIYSDLTEYCLKNPDYCIGGWKGGNYLCIQGHIGALCEECDINNIIGNGKFQKVLKVKCANCNTQNQNIFNYFLVILWSIFSLFISLRSVSRSKQLFRILILNNRYGKIIFKFDQDYQGFILKMLLNYIWIFSIIFSLNLNYQFNFNIFDQASNSSYYLASNLDCFLSENFNMELIYLRILVTYLYIISLFLSMNFILLISSKIYNNQFDKSAITNCLLYLYVQNNSSLIQNFASLISQRIVSDLSFIQGDVALRFDTDTHQAWIKYFIIPNLIFIGILIPGFLISFLASKKNDLDKISLRNHFCYLYNEYSNSCFYWELVKIWKKVIIIIIISYYENSQMHKICLIGVCLILYHHNLATTQPFITKNLNKLDLQSVQYCSISVFIAGLLYASDQIGNLQLALILYIIQIFLILITIFPFIIWIFRIFKKRQILLYVFLVKVCKFFNLKQFQYIFNQYISKLTSREKKLKQNIQNLQRYFRQSHHDTIQIKKLK